MILMSEQYKKAKRSQFMAFLDTTPDAAAPTWNRMGKGITGQTVTYNPQVTTETDIDQDNADSNVDSYQPSINTPQTVYSGEPVFEYINGLRKKRAVGDDCRTHILLVNAFETPAAAGSYSAEKNDCAIQIDEFGGDGGGKLAITYTVNLCGDPVEGTFAPATKTFTETTAATA